MVVVLGGPEFLLMGAGGFRYNDIAKATLQEEVK